MLSIVQMQDDEENALSNAFKRQAITEEGNFRNCDVDSDREVVNKTLETLESCEGCSKSDIAVAKLQLYCYALSIIAQGTGNNIFPIYSNARVRSFNSVRN
jgi:hypothetical protein